MVVRKQGRARKKNPVPAILPRERLTVKAKWAVFEFVKLKTAKLPNLQSVVAATLIAERMRRSELYAWLEAKGYRWNPRLGWRKP